ncbi:MAG: response regulator transcription factor [Flavobacteriales bacterium]|nr:response regulator transcription factor [Flavobacteriales bacterium]
MKKITAIIIDDIEDARKILRSDLAVVAPEISIIGEADSVMQGVKLLAKQTPDILFLDIQMPDGDGFDLLEMLPQKPFKTIFTTASDEHALKAFKFSAVDYLLKPIDQRELETAVAKAKNTKDSPQSLEILQENIGRKIGNMERLILNTQEKIHVVKLDDIVRLESDINYTRFFLANGNKVLVTRTLKDFDEMLTDNGFLRVHQSHLVNINHIKEFVKADGGHINLTDGGYVPVSSRRKAAVLQALENI